MKDPREYKDHDDSQILISDDSYNQEPEVGASPNGDLDKFLNEQ